MNKQFFSVSGISTLFTCLVFLISTGAQAASTNEVKKEGKQLMEATEDYLKQSQQEFKTKMNSQIKELEVEVAKMKNQKTKLNKKSKRALQKADQQLSKLNNDLKEIESQTQDEWEKFQKDVEINVNALEKTIEEAKSYYQS